VTDERRPRPNAPPRQPPVSDEEFRRALERETDLSLREDPERRRFYRAGDLGIPAELCGQLEGDQAAAGRTV
jgi:hypothetical protein